MRPLATIGFALLGACLIAISYGLARFAFGLFVPPIRAELELGADTIGLIGALPFVSFIVATLVAPLTAARLGARNAAILSGSFGVAGLVLAVTIALAAAFLGEHYGAPVMLFALLLGMAFNFLAANEAAAPGIEFASRTLLRVGVAMLGLRLTFDDVAALGWAPTSAVIVPRGISKVVSLSAVWPLR